MTHGNGHFLLGHARAFARAPHLFPAELGWAGGGLAQFRALHKTVLVTTHPDHAREMLVNRRDRYQRGLHHRTARIVLGDGLLTLEGPLWRSRRRQVQPAFRTDRLHAILPAACAATGRLLDRWDEARRDGRPVPVVADMLGLTLAVMGQVLLSAEIGPDDAARFGAALRQAMPLLRQRNTSFPRLPLWIPVARNRRLVAVRRTLDAFVADHIARRRRAPHAEPQDILDALLAARDPDTGAPLDEAALRDETKTLFLAGFETTANALAWTLHLLAGHPEQAAAWHDEIDRVLGDRPPQWEDLDRLTWTQQVINEAMRLYPPVYNVGRQCVADDEIGGQAVRAGTIVLISIFGIHRAPEWWPNPGAFRPERFAAEASWHRHAFLPFASGGHVCVGNSFALTEMVAALALIGQRYRLEPVDSAPVGMAAQITLTPSREILLRPVPRR